MYKKIFISSFLTISLLIPSTQSITFAQANSSEFATPAEVQKQVEEYFADIQVMIEIARCESKFRQFTDAGNVLRGGWNNNMIGVFQFFNDVHQSSALTLGYDIETVDGNLQYARHVYNLSGTQPWNSSAECWKNAPLQQSISTDQSNATDEELLEMIATLQQLITLLETLLERQQLALN